MNDRGSSSTQRYRRYFYHCFPQWLGAREREFTRSFDFALETLESMFRWGLLLTPEDIIFRGERYRDADSAEPIRIVQQRLCFTELSEDEVPDHAGAFGPIALEFDPVVLRRIGAMPVIYIPEPLSINPESDRFALVGHTLVYRLQEVFQVLSDLAEIGATAARVKEQDASITLKRDGMSSGCYSVEMLRNLTALLTHGRQPLSQLAAAIALLSCFFYPADAVNSNQREDDDGRLLYYREREWRITSNVWFGGASIDENLPDEAIAASSPRLARRCVEPPMVDEPTHKTVGRGFTARAAAW